MNSKPESPASSVFCEAKAPLTPHSAITLVPLISKCFILDVQIIVSSHP